MKLLKRFNKLSFYFISNSKLDETGKTMKVLMISF